MLADFWDERFGKEEYAYGTEPNQFLKEQLPNLKRGTILFPCEGEGRNAVYATEQAWNVTAFDQSKAGHDKAMRLSKERFVNFQFDIKDAFDYAYDQQFDAVGIFFVHFPEKKQAQVYERFSASIKNGGYLIGELFAQNQLAYQACYDSSGPQNKLVLLSIDKMKALFPEIDFEILNEQEVLLDEGSFHQGKAGTIRFLGRKKTKKSDLPKE